MPSSKFSRRWNRVLLAILAGITVTGGAGCQSPPAPSLVSCPLPTTEQVHEILAIAPLGTSRDDVLQKLSDAGISGSFGENQSLYYCDLWKRKDDLRWHLNVVLLFDDDGKLYATRPDASGHVDPTPRSNVKAVSPTAADPFLAE
jgi:hypothetical protein